MSVNLGFGGSNAALVFSRSLVMKLDLAIIGQGAVTPAGIGVDALLPRQARRRHSRAARPARRSRGPSCAST